jgi:hypothetical protein
MEKIGCEKQVFFTFVSTYGAVKNEN